jgi:UDP-3-O-[3-hydroxymyristoyl] glucosamine N-acyltransferase
VIRYTIEDIVKLIQTPYTTVGDSAGKYFTELKSTLKAHKNSLTFISHDRADKQDLLRNTAAEIIICDPELDISGHFEKYFIVVDDPRLTFAVVGSALFSAQPHQGIHPTAVVHPNAFIHKESWIGPFSYIGNSEIGTHSIVFGHCFIHDNVRIGSGVRIGAGCVIGGEGFGYLRNDDGAILNFPHVGGVVIEDNVEIGAHTCIDRGALDDTLIKEGAKIDNLVHIAHNVVVGSRSFIIANAVVCGSTAIGNEAWISPSAVLRDQIKVGSRSYIGMGAVVTKSVPDGEVWISEPAKSLRSLTGTLTKTAVEL